MKNPSFFSHPDVDWHCYNDDVSIRKVIPKKKGAANE
jgi:hypothetical protein